MGIFLYFVFQSTFKMQQKKYLEDLSEIKDLMSRSSRFLSLSGLSGVLAGVYALIGAAIAYFFLLPKEGEVFTLHSANFKMLVVLLFAIALLSLLTAFGLSYQKAQKMGEKIWDATTIRLLINFAIPMVTGGLYILIKLNSQHYGLTGSLMLIFYGLALVNASKYTLGQVRYLGYVEIILGLLCAVFPGHGFWFWTLGFGLMHILYGGIMYRKERMA